MNSKQKKIIIRLLLLCITLLSSIIACSQSSTIDSLKKVLQTGQNDTAKVNTLNVISSQFRYENSDTSFYFANTALVLATKLNYKMGIADAKLRIARTCADQGKYNEGVKTGDEALVIYNELLKSATALNKGNILMQIGSAYNVIAHNRLSQGNLTEGLKSSLLALEVREKIGDKAGIAGTEYNIGYVYSQQNNYAEALKHLYVALKLYKELGDKVTLSTAYNAVGSVLFEQGNYDEAQKKYMVALQLANETGDKLGLAEVYISLGTLNDKKGSYDNALQYNLAALEIYTEMKNNDQVALIYNNAGSVYTKQKKYKAAAEYLNKALSLSKEINNLISIKFSYESLAALDSAQGNYQKAFANYKLAISYRDSIINKENTQKLVEQQMQYEFDKKEDSLKQNHLITTTKLQAQKNQKYFYWGGLVMLAMLLFFAFNNFLNQKKINRLAADAHDKQKVELELQNLQALLGERLRISSELHDEVGATLSGIAMYSHLTKEQMKLAQPAEVEKSLNIMQQSSGDMVNKLNDIVWLLNPVQDTLQKLIQRLEEYAGEMTAIKNIKLQTSVPEIFSTQSLSVESRRNIYLFCKEAINNAVKYSEATLLELTVKESNSLLEITIADNGKGFDAETIKLGNGLNNMQKRADELGADFNIQSKPAAGCLISLKVKITH